MLRMLLTIGILAFCAASSAMAADEKPSNAPAKAVSLRVMSFNIRMGTAKDGENHWDKRKDFLVDTIKAYDPDLLGTQEVIAFQGDFLQEKLPQYGFTGGGRNDGKREGELSPIMYKKDRFELLASGMGWLSETPEKVGSKGWDAALPRIVTWAKLKDKSSGAAFLYFNTHWDHIGKVARVESGKLMRRMIDEKRDGLPVVVTGDFNSTETTDQYRSLTIGDGKGPPLIDAYRELYPQRKPDESSFSAWTGKTDGMRIDWVLHSPEWKATAAKIDRTSRNGRYPSDHYPVTAELQLVR